MARARKSATDPLFVDVHLPARHGVHAADEAGYNAFLYTYEGSAEVGPAGDAKPLKHRAAGVLSAGDRVRVRAGGEGARFLLLAARPLREPVVQYGPFVMNTREEIEQALADYRDGRLAAAERRRARRHANQVRPGKVFNRSACTPFQQICTPMQSRMKAVRRTTTPVPVGPSLRKMTSA